MEEELELHGPYGPFQPKPIYELRTQVQLRETAWALQGSLADTTDNVYMEHVNDTKTTKAAPWNNSADLSGALHFS